MTERIELDLEFQDNHTIKECLPNIVIKYSIRNNTRNPKTASNNYLKILFVKYMIEIYVIDVQNRTPWKVRLPDLFTYRSYFTQLQDVNITEELLLPIPSFIMEKVIDTNLSENRIGFKINTSLRYEIYQEHNNGYLLIEPDRNADLFIHDKTHKSDIIFSRFQIEDFLRKNEINTKVKIEIPLINEKVNNSLLSKAISNLTNAKESYIKGNMEAFLINSRNSFLHITEFDKPNSSKKQRIFSREVKDYCLSKIPYDEQDSYKDILRHVGSMVLSLLRILHKFVHEDQDKVRRWPVSSDLELMYLGSNVLLRYLTRLVCYNTP